MKLAYRACDKSGRETADTIEATDSASAMNKLRGRGLFVTEIHDLADSQPTADNVGVRSTRGRSLKSLALFTRQLAVLVASGTPIVEAIGALQRQTKPGRWQETIAAIRTRVEQGASLSDAMASYPECFDPSYCSLVSVGETRGNLSAMLQRLAELKQKQLQVRNSILGAMIYPCLLTGISMAVLILLLAFVVPRFASLFETLDVQLPASTNILVNISLTLRMYWWAVIAVTALACTAVVLWSRSRTGKRMIDIAMVATPQLGRIVKSFAMARITRTLGVLLDGHVSILEALKLTRHATKNVLYYELVTRAEQIVSRGEPVYSAFANERLVPAAVYESMRNGEKSGQLGPLLLNLADFLDEDNDVVLRSLTSIVEPVILIGMGLLVGVVAFSLFMPLFDLTSMVNGSGT